MASSPPVLSLSEQLSSPPSSSCLGLAALASSSTRASHSSSQFIADSTATTSSVDRSPINLSTPKALPSRRWQSSTLSTTARTPAGNWACVPGPQTRLQARYESPPARPRSGLSPPAAHQPAVQSNGRGEVCPTPG